MIKNIHVNHVTSPLLKWQAGFSLVELMVAIALGIFLVIGVTNILFSGQQSFNATNRIARVQENGQLAKNMLINDLKRARYMGANVELQNLGGSVGASAIASTCNRGNTTWGSMVEQGLFGLDNNQIDDNGTTYGCITAINANPGIRIAGTDILTIRYASPWQPTTFNANTLYIRSSFTASWIFAGSNAGDVDNNEQSSNIAGVNDTDPINSTHELIAYSYYVGDSGRDCPEGSSIPSLFRVSLDNNFRPRQVEEIFPGIENFQVQFSTDGSTYVDANAITDWDAVRSTQIWLLARSECPEGGHNDDRSYSSPGTTPDVSNYIPGDSYRREEYTSIISHRN